MFQYFFQNGCVRNVCCTVGFQVILFSTCVLACDSKLVSNIVSRHSLSCFVQDSVSFVSHLCFNVFHILFSNLVHIWSSLNLIPGLVIIIYHTLLFIDRLTIVDTYLFIYLYVSVIYPTPCNIFILPFLNVSPFFKFCVQIHYLSLPIILSKSFLLSATSCIFCF